jgi:hypothetical protein
MTAGGGGQTAPAERILHLNQVDGIRESVVMEEVCQRLTGQSRCSSIVQSARLIFRPQALLGVATRTRCCSVGRL